MRIATILFCEYQATTREGKLDAGGILNLIWGPTFPLTVTQIFLIITFELEQTEWGEHRFTLVLESVASGEHRTLLEQPFAAGGRFHRSTINLASLVLPEPGLYRFHVLADGQRLGDATLAVDDEEPQYPMGPEMPGG